MAERRTRSETFTALDQDYARAVDIAGRELLHQLDEGGNASETSSDNYYSAASTIAVEKLFVPPGRIFHGFPSSPVVRM